jgi:HPt (histidine-containing phosphotransfer) domain-containing protein
LLAGDSPNFAPAATVHTTTIHPPVDLQHLARQTGGNDALGREVLKMFVDGVPADLARLKAAAGKERCEAAHLILGSARAIGAGAVAAAAGAVEAGEGSVDTLEAALAEARTFIAAYLSG